MKKVLIVSTSIRGGSNSEALAEAFLKGAQDAGHTVEKVSLAGKNIGFCKGCLACQKTHQCVINDDAVEIAEKMAAADVVVFATPIYYYEMAGQMKTLLDRMNPLFGTEYRFREVYLLASAAASEKSAVDGALAGLNGWVSCFGRAALKGVLRGVGLDAPGAAAGKPILSSAYEMGKQI